ncbi:MAG: sodium:proton antiporter [Bacteroidetes bacterium]|nr:MAG: sodium:proton antiporter [Bacteroidota bacterium]
MRIKLNIIFYASLLVSLFLIGDAYAKIPVDSAGTRKHDAILNSDVSVELPLVVIEDIPSSITLTFKDPDHLKLVKEDNRIIMLVNSSPVTIEFDRGIGVFEHYFTDGESLKVEYGDFVYESTIKPIPLWLSILPPLIAIVMALIFKEVITSLFIGIFFGGALIGVYREGFVGIFTGLLSVIDTYVVESLNNWDHLSVIIFSMMIGAIVSIISRNGGMLGVVDHISKYAKDARTGQLATWMLGIVIFFDDYANTLVVGNTMRPVTDKLKISREKLSYIVDSTAAPVAAIAFVTTWIGFELGYIESAVENIGIQEGAYSVFINSLQYSFYPIFTLCFMLMLIYQDKDFGPMFKAEVQARNDEITAGAKALNAGKNTQDPQEMSDIEPIEGAKHRWYNAVIPIAIVIIGTMIGLVYTGIQSLEWTDAIANMGVSQKLSLIIGASNSYFALLWASLVGLLVAILLTIGQKIMSLAEAVDSAMKGFKSMFAAIMILILSWSLALVTEQLHTADFITGTMLSGGITPIFIPAITFVLAALIAFSTGSSWGAMAILYPLMLPAAWQVCSVSGLDHETSMGIFYNVVSCVLAGAVLGDHCSPISDTTILSSLATKCNHIEHVRTQLPYAMVVGSTAIVFGTIPAAIGASPLITFPVGLIVLYLIVKFIGEKVTGAEPPVI